MQQDVDAIIIGTGFSGLCVAIKLKQAGIDDFVILERSGTVGGTWRDNHYPGAACDVPSYLYSFSFEPNPNWSHSYGRQPEILEYTQRCAEKYDLMSHMRFNTDVQGARFNSHSNRWEVEASNGATYRGRTLVTGCGAFSKPSTPDIPGIDDFEGQIFHTADWNHDYDITGKRVAVIGTGASAIQVVPAIAPKVGKLTLFQRTAAWVMPKADRPYTPFRKALLTRFPGIQQLIRKSIYWGLEMRVPGFDGRFPGLLKIGQMLATRYLKREVADPELRAKLTPNFGLGCKRILLSNEYYAALSGKNAHVETSGIRAVKGNRVLTNDGAEHEVDVIVCATGFTVTEALTPFPIEGLEGRDLTESWQGTPSAYLGSTVSGFPNLFTMTGPNTGLGHTSMIYMIEAQTAYVVQALKHTLATDALALNVKQDVQDAFNKELQTRLDKTIWATGGCNSWYKTPEGKIAALWPGQTFEYRQRTARFDPGCYEALSVRPAPLPTSAPARSQAAVPAL